MLWCFLETLGATQKLDFKKYCKEAQGFGHIHMGGELLLCTKKKLLKMLSSCKQSKIRDCRCYAKQIN